MSEQLTDSDLELIEARAKAKEQYLLSGRDWDSLIETDELRRWHESQLAMARERLALVAALRAAWKIIGSCERCGSHYEIDPARYCPTCKTWEHYEPDVWPPKTARSANASADAQEPGGG